MSGRTKVRVAIATAVVLAFIGGGFSGSATAAPAASTPIGSRIAWARTNGDILSITKVRGAGRDLIAFGGNFSAVITPDGASRSARNFAVVDEFTGELVYAGNANSYVRSISSWAGTIYIGGDFTTFGGASRGRLAALSPSFSVTSWNPSPGFRIRAVVAGAAGVYFGGDGASVRRADLSSGATTMSQSVSGGSVRALALSPDAAWLYVGGLFETYGGLSRHGLIRANANTGAPDSGFNARFRADTGVGANGTYDGQAGNVLEFNADGSRLLVGVAGYGSDEFKTLNPTTGSLYWGLVLPGDCQGIGVVGSTYVLGYHRHDNNPWPYFAAQVEATNGVLTNYNPGLTGYQGNADGGNNGVQAVYADPVNRRLFLAGAFTSPVQSIAVFTWGAPTTPPTTTTTTTTSTTTTSTTMLPPGSTTAADSFSRTVAGGFGSADVGGAWTTTGAASRFSVSGGLGRMSLPPGSGVRADLLGVQSSSVDLRSSIGVDVPPTGGGLYAALVGRRISSADDYRLKLRLLSNGTVAAQLVRVVGGAETALQTVFTVPGVSYSAGERLQVRLRVTGTGPTALAAKVWEVGTVEPPGWTLQATDSASSLQRPGSVAYWTYLSSSATRNPTVVSVDDLSVVAG